MIVCTNCDVIVQKNTFCTDKCRKEHHRKDATVKNVAKKDIKTAEKYLAEKKEEEIDNRQPVGSEWPTIYLGKPISGRKATCPICHEETPVEFANAHYAKKHEDI